MRVVSIDRVELSPSRLLGAELTALRISRHWDQQELAKKSGISIEDIKILERGRSGGFADPNYLAAMLRRLCTVFQIDSTNLTDRIFRLMVNPRAPVREPDVQVGVLIGRSRYFYAGLLLMALLVPFAGLWWLVRF